MIVDVARGQAGSGRYIERGIWDGIHLLEHPEMDDRATHGARDYIRAINDQSISRGEGRLTVIVMSPRDWAKFAAEILADEHMLVR